MPEGPSLVLAKNNLSAFVGQKIITVAGHAGSFIQQLRGQHLVEIHTWGKVLLLCSEDFVVRIHFLMFGSYNIDAQIKKETSIKLSLKTSAGAIFFYTCSVKLLAAKALLYYDWESDVLDESWNKRKARWKLKLEPDAMACDALLDQQIFSGVGNIIKNEVLFRIRLHPETKVGAIPATILSKLVAEASNYSFDFLKWKEEGSLKQHWLVHTKKTCSRCNTRLEKKYCGHTKRRTFFCNNCQVKYGR